MIAKCVLALFAASSALAQVPPTVPSGSALTLDTGFGKSQFDLRSQTAYIGELICEEYGFNQSCSRNPYHIKIDFGLNTLNHAMTTDHVRGCGWPPAHSLTEYGGEIKITGDGTIQLLRKPSEFSVYFTYGVLRLTEDGQATFVSEDGIFEPQQFHCRYKN